MQRQQIAPFLQQPNGWADSALFSMTLAQKIDRYLLIQATTDQALDTMRFRPGGFLFEGLGANGLAQHQAQWNRPGYVPLFYGLVGNPRDDQAYQVPIHPVGYHAEDSAAFYSQAAFIDQIQRWGIHLWLRPGLQAYRTNHAFPHLRMKLAAEQTAFQEAHILYGIDRMDWYHPELRDSAMQQGIFQAYDTLTRYGLSAITLAEASNQRISPDLRTITPQISPYLHRTGFAGLLLSPVTGTDLSLRVKVRQAVMAGSDALVVKPSEAMLVRKLVADLVQQRLLPEAELDRRIRRVLQAQSWANQRQPASEPIAQVPTPRAHNAFQRIEAPALLRNPKQILPIKDLYQSAIHVIQVGEKMPHLLQQMRWYGPISHSHATPDQALALKKYRRFRPIILTLNWAESEAVDTSFWRSIYQLSQRQAVLLVNFNDPMMAAQLPLEAGLIQAYHTDSLGQAMMGQLIMGGQSLRGKTALEVPGHIQYAQGIPLPANRLGFAYPEMAQMDPQALQQIDSIAYQGISRFAMPGCQVLVARKGQVVFHKSFGHHTYTRRRAVMLTDVYDIASISKVAGTTVAAMHMQGIGRISLHKPIRTYLRQRYFSLDSAFFADTTYIVQATPTRGLADSLDIPLLPLVPVVSRQSNVKQVDTFAIAGTDSLMIVRTYARGKIKRRSPVLDVTPAQLLTHHSGLPAGIPKQAYTRSRRRFPQYTQFYKPTKNERYTVEVAKNMYLRRDYLDSLWSGMLQMDVVRDSQYRYSDANMVLMQMVIDSINRMSMDSFLMKEIYLPMGFQYMRYHPLRYISKDRIVPTETDRRWRYQSLRGYVHDETAALFGGMAGNAGVFSNAADLGHLFQMILSHGTYGGKSYLSPKVVNRFTSFQQGTRGFGFDLVGKYGHNYAGSLARPGTFGHTGYTGTCVWVDPEEELVFIFLSNRVHPTRANNDLNTYRIRQRMHDAAYQALP